MNVPPSRIPCCSYAEQIGWQYVNPPEALRLRGDETGLYVSDILMSQLQKLNPGVVDPSRASEILRKLNLLRPSIEGNRDALSWLRGEQDDKRMGVDINLRTSDPE